MYKFLKRFDQTLGQFNWYTASSIDNNTDKKHEKQQNSDFNNDGNGIGLFSTVDMVMSYFECNISSIKNIAIIKNTIVIFLS